MVLRRSTCLWILYVSVALWLGLSVTGGVAASGGSETVYIVRKNDTLTRIAANYGLTVTELARHNGIARGGVIYVGQRLRIPSKSSKAKPPDPVLGSAVENAIASAKVRKGRWRYIVLHHSGTASGTLKGMDEYHRTRRRMENGLAYHFVIGNGDGMSDGAVAVGRRWTEQINGGHLASESLNEIAIGICLVGNFDAKPPTKKQLAALDALIRALRARCDLPASAVRTHQQINPIYTRCPGRHFPTGDFASGSTKRK